ncbi:MAG TPA: anthranilate synthase component I [Burkholderiales bacterium]|nr:anthranilate synthase component I [Burkholderiales bacterium]
MTETDFKRLAAQGFNRVPLVLETFADLDTPLSIYLKLANRPYSYLLESVQGGERFGRYSFIGLPAQTRIVVRGHKVLVLHGETVTEDIECADPLALIGEYLRRFRAAPLEGLPRFAGGLVGYFGYDTVRYVEPKLARKAEKPDPIGTPDIVLLQSEEIAIVDNLAGKLYLVVYADPRNPLAFAHGRQRLRELLEALRRPVEIPAHGPTVAHQAQSGFGEATFLQAVAKAKQYIFDGDVMQVQVGQRLSRRYTGEPLALYRALRTLNPSPYMFYFDFRDFNVVGASPEILVRLEGDKVTLRPIAGTRRRGADADEDRALAEELLADPKERAEHVMLIDLGRNDVGRIAEIGSVRVTENMVIERYSHVMHIVSNVEGKLKRGLDALAVLRATFPAGTVTGTPKVRAMEIIDELEPVKRGIYAGAVGYIGYHGDMDLAIAIRTGVLKDELLHVQAAAGIVADSVPESEWNETNIKARALLRAAEMATAGLDSKVQ